ncbi:hypothetical protein GTJ46_01530 [Xanthomonas hortorum pv. gardneri]
MATVTTPAGFLAGLGLAGLPPRWNFAHALNAAGRARRQALGATTRCGGHTPYPVPRSTPALARAAKVVMEMGDVMIDLSNSDV